MVRWLQLVIVVDAVLADIILGSQEGLSKAMEPDLSDALLSHGHSSMFSSETNSQYWRLIRKGTAPAFISANIKCAFPQCPTEMCDARACLSLPSCVCHTCLSSSAVFVGHLLPEEQQSSYCLHARYSEWTDGRCCYAHCGNSP